MATNPNTLSENAGRITAPDVDYPYGSAQDDSTGTTGDGTPIKKAILNDTYGLQQALLRLSSIVPSGNADTALVSEYLQALVELSSGRGGFYDEEGTSAADAYVIDLVSGQQGPASLFDNLGVVFDTAFTSTGASTIDVSLMLGESLGTTIKDIKTADGADPSAGDITGRTAISYNLANDRFEILEFGGGGPSLGSNSIIRTNAQNIAEDITFVGDENGSTVGPVTIDTGFTVTVTSGSTWVVI